MKWNRSKTLFCVLGTVTTIVVGSAPANAAGLTPSATPAATVESAEAAQLSSQDNIPYLTAVGDLQRQEALVDVVVAAQQANPDTFGAAFFDYAHTTKLTLGFVSGTPVLSVPAALTPYVQTVTVARSAVQLTALQSLVQQTANNDLTVPFSTYQNGQANQVVLAVPARTDIAAGSELSTLLTAAGSAVTVKTGYTPSSLAACDSWTCPTPMRGGTEIDYLTSGSSGFVCSTAFVAKANINQNLPVVLSAGHCASSNQYTEPGPNDTFTAGPAVGTMINSGNGDVNDSMSINMSGTAFQASTQPWIYKRAFTSSSADLGYHTTPSNEQFTVVGVASAGSYAATGSYLCKSARTTFYTCGSLNQQNVSLRSCESGTTTCYQYNGFFGASMCTNGGDSGGPIFDLNSASTGGRAYGIVSSTSTYSSCDGSSETYSATIPNITSRLGVTIITGTPPPVQGPVV